MALKKESTLNEEVLNQVKANFFSSVKENEPPQKDEKKDYSDNYILRLPKGERSRIKMFCAGKEISMSSFIMFAIDHLMTEVEEGRCQVSKTGVKKLQIQK